MAALETSQQLTRLRVRLDEIANNFPLDQHAQRIAQLAPQLAHSIEVVPAPATQYPYNCVMHAFALTHEDFEPPQLAAYQARTAFLDFLIAGGRLGAEVAPAPGRLIIYADAERAHHVGVMASATRVRSKWGTGLLYEHPIAEVPASFGTDTCVFTRPDHEQALDLFWDWLNQPLA